MRRITPSFVVSIVALVLAAAGTSVAAISFAKNAGAVDGKSATGAASSQKNAAGKLVATASGGPLKSKVPARFLDLSAVVSGAKATFAQGIEVVDNATSAPVALANQPGLGLVTATCADQNAKAAAEDPQVTVTFANTSGQSVNFSRTVGNGAPAVSIVAPATQNTFTINNSNTFELYAETGTTHYVLHGVVRQDGQNTATGTCAVWGYALTL
ncbi:MAG: hypothetical protein JWM73_3021 [Solirubrobacterales bacterium]|jgi:hypothetical protein|nr:hypothetical protein [Solirubrobacterales bacterium]